MIYHSTRSRTDGVNARDALLKGLRADGGLSVCDSLDECRLTPEDLKGLTYRDTALRVFSLLLGDFTETELAHGIACAYGNTFASDAVTPVTPIGK